MQDQAFNINISYIGPLAESQHINHLVSHSNSQPCHAAALGLQQYINVTAPSPPGSRAHPEGIWVMLVTETRFHKPRHGRGKREGNSVCVIFSSACMRKID